MANETLGETIEMVRHEASQSASMAHGASNRDQIAHLINRVQQQLATQFDWPRRGDTQEVAITAGTDTYDIPSPFDFEAIEQVLVDYHDQAIPLAYGIRPADLAYLGTGVGDRRWPPQRWELAGSDQIKLWPVPRDDGKLYITGTGTLTPLTKDRDRLAFSGYMVALYVAAELLAKQGDTDAAAQANAQAEALRRTTLYRQDTKKGGVFYMGKGEALRDANPRPRYGIDYVD